MLCVKVSTVQNPLQLSWNILRTGLNEKSHKEIGVGAFFLGSWRDLFLPVLFNKLFVPWLLQTDALPLFTEIFWCLYFAEISVICGKFWSKWVLLKCFHWGNKFKKKEENAFLIWHKFSF